MFKDIKSILPQEMKENSKINEIEDYINRKSNSFKIYSYCGIIISIASLLYYLFSHEKLVTILTVFGVTAYYHFSKKIKLWTFTREEIHNAFDEKLKVTNTFVQAKELSFHNMPNGGSWIGLDSKARSEWVLSFQADQRGPTTEQINIYNNFILNHESVCNDIKYQVIAKIPPGEKTVVNSEKYKVDIFMLHVTNTISDYHVEIEGYVYFRQIIFKKKYQFLVRLKDLKLSLVVLPDYVNKTHLEYIFKE